MEATMFILGYVVGGISGIAAIAFFIGARDE